MTGIRASVVLQGIWLMVFGVVFLAAIGGSFELRPALLWPSMLIAWGTALLVDGVRR
jgi:hypothetical protein